MATGPSATAATTLVDGDRLHLGRVARARHAAVRVARLRAETRRHRVVEGERLRRAVTAARAAAVLRHRRRVAGREGEARLEGLDRREGPAAANIGSNKELSRQNAAANAAERRTQRAELRAQNSAQNAAVPLLGSIPDGVPAAASLVLHLGQHAVVRAPVDSRGRRATLGAGRQHRHELGLLRCLGARAASAELGVCPVGELIDGGVPGLVRVGVVLLHEGEVLEEDFLAVKLLVTRCVVALELGDEVGVQVSLERALARQACARERESGDGERKHWVGGAGRGAFVGVSSREVEIAQTHREHGSAPPPGHSAHAPGIFRGIYLTNSTG
eukprot:5715766-Prymnesium_polylepis.2